MTAQKLLQYFFLTLTALAMYWVPAFGCCTITIVGGVALVLSIAKKPVASWAWFLTIQGLSGAALSAFNFGLAFKGLGNDNINMSFLPLAALLTTMHWLILIWLKKLP